LNIIPEDNSKFITVQLLLIIAPPSDCIVSFYIIYKE